MELMTFLGGTIFHIPFEYYEEDDENMIHYLMPDLFPYNL